MGNITYTTISGDTFDKVAFNVYEDEMLAGEIIDANIDLAHIVIFDSGTVLQIPEIDTTSVANLPPWKR